MLLVPLPFEYITYLEPGDRGRRRAARHTGTRIRRQPATTTE